jgi:ABC-type lipoprotein release transport system permease subunit
VLLGAIVVLGAVVFVASALPALRAARGNPSLSLRAD